GSNLTRNIDAHRVHEQEVLVVLLQAHLIDDTGRHGESGNTGSTDHGVDLFLAEDVVQLGNENAAHGVEDESDEAQAEDHQRLGVEEALRLHLGGHGQAQEQGDQVGQDFLCRLGQAVQNAALTDQVAEHQETDEGNAAGSKDARDHGDEDGEQDLGGLGNALFRILHADLALLFGSDHADDRRLDDGNQRHIGVSHHDDRADILGLHIVTDENGGGAVRRADDGNGGRVPDVKAEQRGQAEGEEDAELC